MPQQNPCFQTISCPNLNQIKMLPSFQQRTQNILFISVNNFEFCPSKVILRQPHYFLKQFISRCIVKILGGQKFLGGTKSFPYLISKSFIDRYFHIILLA